MIDEGHERQVTPAPQDAERLRRAVGPLLVALDAAARNGAARQGGGAPFVDADAAELYDAALTVAMRLVYLPVAARLDVLAGRAGVASMALTALHCQLGAWAAADGRTALARQYDAWPRLCVLLRVVHAAWEEPPPLPARGLTSEVCVASRERHGGLPAGDVNVYEAGSDPSFVTGSPILARLQYMHINNNSVLDLLDSILHLQEWVGEGVKTARADGPEGDSCATIIEGIGAIYQQLRDDTAVRAVEPLLGLAACAGRAPFLPLRQLEAEHAVGDAALMVYLRRATGRAVTALAADLAGSGVARRGAPASCDDNVLTACGGDTDLCRRVRPFARLLRVDDAGCPVVVPGGRVYIKGGRGRRASGLHYTPPPVAAAVVRHALDQVAYEGTARDAPRAEWRLRPAAELLELKICDMAMGCGVFLVESCRYLADRLTEAWALAELACPDARIDTEGRPVGEDAMARAIPQEPLARLALARRLVAGRCLYGVDKDPIAVELASLVLRAVGDGRWAMGEDGEDAGVAWPIVSGRLADLSSTLDRRLRVGDALVGAPAAYRPSPAAHRSFDWLRAFPEVFARERGRAGFDAIVGNPPFGNGIEDATARDSLFRCYAAAHYTPFAHGAGDYCLLFWGRALLHLLAPGGAYGWLSPTTLLSDLKPWQAWVHAHARPTTLILYPVNLFPRARIRTTAYCGRRGQSSRVTIIDHDTAGTPARSVSPPDPCQTPAAGEPLPVTRAWPAALMCWYEVTRRPGTSGISARREQGRDVDMASLAGLPVRLHAGCATAAAYELAPLVADDFGGHGARLVTTGALDRYVCTWGRVPIRYLHRTYHHPRWPAAHPAVPLAVVRALDRQRGPKILVGGLSAALECWLDRRGDAAGVVSTWVVAPGEGVTLDGLYLLLAVLNSATFSRLYMERYGARSMSGRQTTIYKQALRAMPCPRVVGPAMRSSRQEWRGSLNLDTAAGWLAVCEHISRVLQEIPVDHPRRGALDRLGHLTVGLLYGRGEDGAADDYTWWCERGGVEPDDTPPRALVDLLVGDYG